ncbi:MAG: hypothetical protein KF821_09145 [Anaerolineales bacterium]|nr:hypothetical protein [Anaerolineales bacterium]
MARLSQRNTSRRDRVEEVSFALGSLRSHLDVVELRLRQITGRVPGIASLAQPALDSVASMRLALSRARRALTLLAQDVDKALPSLD